LIGVVVVTCRREFGFLDTWEMLASAGSPSIRTRTWPSVVTIFSRSMLWPVSGDWTSSWAWHYCLIQTGLLVVWLCIKSCVSTAFEFIYIYIYIYIEV
jgi:hypothetical protein